MAMHQLVQPIYDNSVTNTVELARGFGCYLYFLEVQNGHTADNFLQLFDAAAAADVTLGTTVPTLALVIPGSGAQDKMMSIPVWFQRGLCYAITATATGNGSPTTAGRLNLGIAS